LQHNDESDDTLVHKFVFLQFSPRLRHYRHYLKLPL